MLLFGMGLLTLMPAPGAYLVTARTRVEVLVRRVQLFHAQWAGRCFFVFAIRHCDVFFYVCGK